MEVVVIVKVFSRTGRIIKIKLNVEELYDSIPRIM
jgi:hypothetical protein